jgi:hypothetical protein
MGTAGKFDLIRTPQSLGGTSVRITINVDYADAVVERAVARGARVQMPVQNVFWGDALRKVHRPLGPRMGRQPASSLADSRGIRRRILYPTQVREI